MSAEEGMLFADTIKHMKQNTQYAEVTSPENLMPYDPAIPQGKEEGREGGRINGVIRWFVFFVNWLSHHVKFPKPHR